MILRVNASAAVSEQLRTDLASDGRLGRGEGRSTGISKKKTRNLLVHRGAVATAAARRPSEEARNWI